MVRRIENLRPGEFVTLLVDGEDRETARYICRETGYDGFTYRFIAWDKGRGYDWYLWKDGTGRLTYGGGAHTVEVIA